jgi:hypothetical protein
MQNLSFPINGNQKCNGITALAYWVIPVSPCKLVVSYLIETKAASPLQNLQL